MLERDGDGFVFAKRCLAVAIHAVFRSPHHHVAHAGGEECGTLLIGVFVHSGVEFAIIVDFKFHQSIFHRAVLGVNHLEIDAGCGAIVVNQIDFGVVAGAQHHLFGSTIVAECTGVHQHGARGRSVEPAEVENGFGLASAEEVPLSIGPSLHPRMVVVGVCPSWGIYLACWNAHRAQSRHGECAFLAASPDSRFLASHWRKRARIRWLIGDMLVAPVVHLQNGVFHA